MTSQIVPTGDGQIFPAEIFSTKKGQFWCLLPSPPWLLLIRKIFLFGSAELKGLCYCLHVSGSTWIAAAPGRRLSSCKPYIRSLLLVLLLHWTLFPIKYWNVLLVGSFSRKFCCLWINRFLHLKVSRFWMFWPYLDWKMYIYQAGIHLFFQWGLLGTCVGDFTPHFFPHKVQVGQMLPSTVQL